MSMKVWSWLCLGAVVLSCGSPKTEPPPPAPAKIHTTYRIIAGVSMGAIGSSALGFSHADKFDGIAPLGGPFDAAYVTRMIDDFWLGGFCTRPELEAALAANPHALNDPTVMEACADRATPGTWEHPNAFNHWHVTTNGGTFNRDDYLSLLEDLSLAFGNFLTQNPDSPFAPPGVPVEKVRHPAADFCTNPIKVKGLKNLEYNADGKYDAITFCDGEPTLFYCRDSKTPVDFCSVAANKLAPLPRSQERAFADTFCAGQGGAVEATKGADALYVIDHWGHVDACREPFAPMRVALAWDYNGNGKRDYGEPIVNNSHERWDDVGVDGCANAFEDGKGGCTATAGTSTADANHDDYDPVTNPGGTERDWRYEQGEPYRDDGLDGVPGTGDVGEGNGAYDLSVGRQKLFAMDGRTNFLKLDANAQKRIDVYLDGGIRDVFNLGLMARHLFSAIRLVRGADKVGSYREFAAIPGLFNERSNSFDPFTPKWKSLPRDIEMLYGKENPTDGDRVAGEGDHVGNATEAIYRFENVFNWAAWAWPTLTRPATPLGGSTAGERQRLEWFDSRALHAKWEYAVALPPGYDAPENADQRYPVVFMLHGYGMEPGGFVGTSVITDAFVTDPNVRLRPIIYVYPNGRCCWTKPTGERDCRNQDDAGHDLNESQGWARECNSGTFWINRTGYTATDGTAYGDAFFELMEHIDATYRTVPAADVEAR